MTRSNFNLESGSLVNTISSLFPLRVEARLAPEMFGVRTEMDMCFGSLGGAQVPFVALVGVGVLALLLPTSMWLFIFIFI